LKPRGSTGCCPRAVETRSQQRQVFVKKLADPLFVAGDRLDIDQRARELEYVHKMCGRGSERRRKLRVDGQRISTPIALHPPE
jgi:hypothetical protein